MSKQVILCVDDEFILLKSLRDELRDAFGSTHSIEIADGGQSALELVEELLEEGYEIPVVISDYIMPDLKGDELLRQVHHLSPQTLNIMLTGQATIEAVANAVKYAQLYRYIAKPWQQEDLRLTVSEALHAYQQAQQLTEQRLKLLHLNQALEEANRTLEQRVSERTQELSQALEQLKAAQETLIESEKMAALGQLVAGVAHEINTPMGAIRSSISSLTLASERALKQLPQLLRTLSEERLADFYRLLEIVQSQKGEILVSHEERQIRRALSAELEAHGFTQVDSLVMKLLQIGVTQNIAEFFPLLRDPVAPEILEAVQMLAIQRNSGGRIQLAVEKASKIVFALKTYAYPGDSTQVTQANLAESIDLVLTIYHNSLKHQVEVIKQYEPVPPIDCCIDELNQVWTNLIHNALQAMNQRGTLVIRLFQEQDTVVVQFTDSGSGIPPEIQSKIFDPFFTTKPIGEGSGIGLSIVQRIIDRHKGRIRVTSQPGQTTFSITLPIALSNDGGQYGQTHDSLC